MLQITGGSLELHGAEESKKHRKGGGGGGGGAERSR